MDITQIVFSPTGGTQRVADIVAAGLGTPANRIDLTAPGFDGSGAILKGTDTVLIAVPSYGGRVPALAAQRLSAIHGGGARCIIICVYGNRAYEDTLAELFDLAQQGGFRVIAAVSAVAEHSIIHQYAAGRPDQRDQEQLRKIADDIRRKLEEGDLSAPQIPGNRPYKAPGGAGLVPKADKNCTGCGLCAEQCPAQAISREHIKTADSKKCISCMRCVTQCPQSARKVSGVMVSAAALALKKACEQRKVNERYL